MWLCTKYGFFSIVCAHEGRRETPHEQLMMIRSRKREHLVQLRRFYDNIPADVRPTKGRLPRIMATPHRDYPYRIIVDRVVARKLVEYLMSDIWYTNFKDEVHQFKDDTSYNRFLGVLWGMGRRMLTHKRGQRIKEYI